MTHKRVMILIVVLAALLLAAMACDGGTVTPPPSATDPGPTAVATNTHTAPTVAPSATAIETPTPIVRPALNTANKAACPNFQCQVNEQGYFEQLGEDKITRWNAWTRSGETPKLGHEYNPQHILVGWRAGQLEFNQFQNSANFGLYQTFSDLQAGAIYRVTGWGFGFAGPGDPPGTPSKGWVKIWVGIDPYGGTDPDADTVIWSAENANMLGALLNVSNCLDMNDVYTPQDIYDPYGLDFAAISNTATLFIRVETDFAYNVATATFDGFTVNAVGWVEDYGLPAFGVSQ